MEFQAEDMVFADLVVDEEICLEIHFAENIRGLSLVSMAESGKVDVRTDTKQKDNFCWWCK